jgi:hypothetical protein
MSTTNNSTTFNTKEDIAFTEMFNRSGLKHLIVAHQQTTDYMGTVANIYNPMIYTLPKEVIAPTKEEKAVLARMLRREKEMMGKIRRLIEAADRDCNELLSELGFKNPWAAGWNDEWGNAAQPQAPQTPQANKNNDGANDNAEAN